MEIKNVKVYGLEESIIRSGYPMQIGEPKDLIIDYEDFATCEQNSLDRSKKLANTPSGSGHNNFLKGIIVQFDLQYPEYFSPQLQRYHWFDIVSSQSKMHRIMSRELTMGDFSGGCILETTLNYLNSCINEYNSSNEIFVKSHMFYEVLNNLPMSYMKWMAISTNYLQLKTVYNQRKTHKLEDWRFFCEWIESIPMSYLITNKNK